MKKAEYISESPLSKFLFANKKAAWVWLAVRLYVGWAWLQAGLHKVGEAKWTGDMAGDAMKGFITGALTKTEGAHPDVQGWYAWFLENVMLPHTDIWGPIIAWGEVVIGIALILGLFTGIMAFLGSFLNVNFLLAGTVSTNPILFVLATGLVLGWRVAGYIGLDQIVLPYLGVPWKNTNSS